MPPGAMRACARGTRPPLEAALAKVGQAWAGLGRGASDAGHGLPEGAGSARALLWDRPGLVGP